MKSLSQHIQEFVVARQSQPAQASTPDPQVTGQPDATNPKDKKKGDKNAAKGKTDSGQPRNQIDVNPKFDTQTPFYEDAGKHAVFTFARMNPPTAGHEKLVNAIVDHAKKVGGDPHVYLSKSHDKQKNPIDYETKHELATKAFGKVVKHTPEGHSNIAGVLRHLNNLGYTHATLLVGGDRVDNFKRMATAYNGPDKHYNFKKIVVKSVGERDPDSDGVEGVSSSKLRSLASAGMHNEFKQGLPTKLQKDSKEVMNAVRGSLHESSIILESAFSEQELNEYLSAQQRIRKATKFRTARGKVKLGRKRALKRKASRTVLMQRARRMAVKFLKARMLRGTSYDKLSYTGRANLDKRLKIKTKSVTRLATKLMPRLQQAEQRRKIGSGFKSIKGLGAIAGMPGSRKVVREQLLDAISTLTETCVVTPAIVEALGKKAIDSGIDYTILETVYRRGVVDFAAGHRPDMTPQQWAFNRVNSFIHQGASFNTVDSDLAEQVAGDSVDINMNPFSVKAKKEKETVRRQRHVVVHQQNAEIKRAKAPGLNEMNITENDTMDRKPEAEGTNIKVNSPGLQHHGKRGVITQSNRDGSFHVVKFNSGKQASFHGSDLQKISEEGGAGYDGTDELTHNWAKSTPGEPKRKGFKKWINK
jgi:hypothetical protein